MSFSYEQGFRDGFRAGFHEALKLAKAAKAAAKTTTPSHTTTLSPPYLIWEDEYGNTMTFTKDHLHRAIDEWTHTGVKSSEILGLEDWEINTVMWFSLVELPNEKHVPLPIPLEWGREYRDKLKKLPIAEKVRDRDFYGISYFDSTPLTDELEREYEEKEKTLKQLLDNNEFDKLKIVLAVPPQYRKYEFKF